MRDISGLLFLRDKQRRKALYTREIHFIGKGNSMHEK